MHFLQHPLELQWRAIMVITITKSQSAKFSHWQVSTHLRENKLFILLKRHCTPCIYCKAFCTQESGPTLKVGACQDLLTSLFCACIDDIPIEVAPLFIHHEVLDYSTWKCCRNNVDCTKTPHFTYIFGIQAALDLSLLPKIAV